MIVLLNKPFDVLCQFTAEPGKATLKSFINIKNLYPSGRLDRDSEGLVLLTDEGHLQHLISHPRHKLDKRYWVQVEGLPGDQALNQLRQGVTLKDGITAPAKVRIIEAPQVWPRTPPIRYRAHIPTTWLELTLREGRNRQVRRMTAAVGYPTLRLIRVSIGPWSLEDLPPGEYRIAPLNLDKLPAYWRKYLSDSSSTGKTNAVHSQRKRKPRRTNHIK